MQVQSTQVQESRTAIAEQVIPSVPGEFYSYSPEFSINRPLGYLMKCKANKSRPVEEAEHIDHEIDLTFVFGNSVRVCSPIADPSVRLLGDLVSDVVLGQTRIATADITEDAFYHLRQQKDGPALAQFCREAVAACEAVVELSMGTIFAVTTESGKYGLFLVKEITPSSIKIDACHILLR